jgi:hypothetical protein
MIEGSCHCGEVRWTFEGVPEASTACNCTACRRYGVLWAYDYEGEGGSGCRARPRPTFEGIRSAFISAPSAAAWPTGSLTPGEDGRRRIAVNLRLAEPDAVGAIPIEHFDGLEAFDDLGRDGRSVADMWF